MWSSKARPVFRPPFRPFSYPVSSPEEVFSFRPDVQHHRFGHRTHLVVFEDGNDTVNARCLPIAFLRIAEDTHRATVALAGTNDDLFFWFWRRWRESAPVLAFGDFLSG